MITLIAPFLCFLGASSEYLTSLHATYSFMADCNPSELVACNSHIYAVGCDAGHNDTHSGTLNLQLKDTQDLIGKLQGREQHARVSIISLCSNGICMCGANSSAGCGWPPCGISWKTFVLRTAWRKRTRCGRMLQIMP